ncbi:hypothetical protein Hanom_Chr10g00941291 [Helianthus anomalus]
MELGCKILDQIGVVPVAGLLQILLKHRILEGTFLYSEEQELALPS